MGDASIGDIRSVPLSPLNWRWTGTMATLFLTCRVSLSPPCQPTALDWACLVCLALPNMALRGMAGSEARVKVMQIFLEAEGGNE